MKKTKTFKKFFKGGLLAFSLLFVLSATVHACEISEELKWNFMSGDQETLRMKNDTQNQASWEDPISADGGDQVKFLLYYHCGWEKSSWPDEKARETAMRINFPTYKKQNIETVAQLWACNIQAIDDTGVINVSTAEKLVFSDTATWHHEGTQETVPVDLHSSYAEVHLPQDVTCDPLDYYNNTGFVVFEAQLTETSSAPTVDLKADNSDGPITIGYGEDTQLSWTSTDADSCTASGDWSGDKGTSGSEWKNNLTEDKTYNITCTGEGGSASDSVKIYVEEQSTLNVDLQATPDSGEAPLKDVDLEANVSGTASGKITYRFDCTDDGTWDYIYSDTEENPKTVYNACDYTSEGTYTAKVRVEREGLTATDVDTVNVSYVPAPNVDIKVNSSNGPVTVDYGSDVKLTWTSDNSSSCTASGDWSGDKGTSGSEWKNNLTEDKTYNITCTGEGGSASDSVKIYVEEQSTLNVDLQATPDSGEAPLKDVDLEANVSGTASGKITYRFDCTDNGTWDHIINSYSETKNIENACDYNDEGTYKARVRVEREGLTATDTDTIEVYEEDKTLSVHLQAIPNSGTAPLENVDLEADVSGSASGKMTYKFDCTNDGTWEYTYSDTYDENFRVNNACDYDKAGTYKARVKVYRDGKTTTDTDSVTVGEVAGEVTFEIEKKVRNLTEGETSWKKSTNASPSDKVAYRIVVYAPDDHSVSNLTVKDSLNRMRWYGNLKIEGESSSGDIAKGITIKSIPAGDKVTITFEALLEEKEEFGYGTTDLVNAVLVYNDDYSLTDTATVFVQKTKTGEAVTEVPTGIMNDALLALGVTILVSYGLLVLFFLSGGMKENTPVLEGWGDKMSSKLSNLFYSVRPWYTKKHSEHELREKIEKARK